MGTGSSPRSEARYTERGPLVPGHEVGRLSMTYMLEVALGLHVGGDRPQRDKSEYLRGQLETIQRAYLDIPESHVVMSALYEVFITAWDEIELEGRGVDAAALDAALCLERYLGVDTGAG